MCMVEMATFNIQRAITLTVGKQELRFMYSACHLMVFNIHVQFHENMSSGFRADTKIVNRHTHTQRKDENYIPHCGGITRVTVHMFCMSSLCLTFV